MILKEKVDFVLGPYSSEITEAILPVAEKYGYPVLVSGASSDRLWQKGYRNAFGVFTAAGRYTIGFLEMLVIYDLNDIAILYADDSFSVDIAEGAKKWADRFGIKVVMFEGFKKKTADFDKLAAKAKSSKAQALILCGHFDESVNMRLSLKKIQWHPKAYFASVGPAMQAYHDKLKSDAAYTFSTSQWEHESNFNPPACCAFYEEFIKTYNKIPSYHAATAYAAGEVLEAAVKKAGSIDRDILRKRLFTLDILTIIGRYGVDMTGMQVKHLNLIIQWQNGKKEVVWPADLSTAKPVFK
jgi:branched-chain amino acid transport system substrate-binding protein